MNQVDDDFLQYLAACWVNINMQVASVLKKAVVSNYRVEGIPQERDAVGRDIRTNGEGARECDDA